MKSKELISISVSKTNVTEVKLTVTKIDIPLFRHEHSFNFPLSFYDTISSYNEEKLLFLIQECLTLDAHRVTRRLPLELQEVINHFNC